MGTQGRRRGFAATLAAAGAAAAIAPAGASADGLMAAYERYEAGRGFEIGMLNVGTGQPISVPASVNTTADELHPALSPDGRYLVFMRTTLQPQLNGNILPPAARSLVRLDRTTGEITTLRGSEGAGPAFRATGSTTRLAWGIRPETRNDQRQNLLRFAPFTSGTIGSVGSDMGSTSGMPPGSLIETTHAQHAGSVIRYQPASDIPAQFFPGRYMTVAAFDQVTGAVLRSQAALHGDAVGFHGFNEGHARTIGDAADPASHPVARPGDNYVALHRGAGAAADIHSIAFPTESSTSPAPAAINTSAAERMPAWAPPNGNQLGFVRTANGRRLLGVFDLTPGIQNPLNPPTDIGPEAPTPQTRAYQEVWGGLSLAFGPLPSVPTVTCTTCVTSGSLSKLVLVPRVSLTTSGQQIGILVARVTGRRTLLGRRVPRIRVVGRVPLGRTKKGRNRFRWNGKVEGKRLKRGRYLLTYRTLKRGRILSTSGSVRFTVTKAGRVRGVRRLR